MTDQGSSVPKKIVYVMGAGATQAEVSFRGGEPLNLLMRDNTKLGEGIATRIMKKSRLKKPLGIEDEVDIEKLISLLWSTGNKKDRDNAIKLRELYYKEIVEGRNQADVLNKPALASCLLDMHKNVLFDGKIEALSGVISLNHDNLFHVASQEIHGGLNLGFHFHSTDYTKNEEIPSVIQLHGCFGWINEHPIRVKHLALDGSDSNNLLWIPPTILKESKEYPFNKLSGLSYELLANRCDVLRIVGCSLSQNDWNLISLIFISQHKQFITTGNCYNIELIVDHQNGETVKKEYSYLHNVIPIGYLTDGDFSDYLHEDDNPDHTELDNPFVYWLKKKVLYHMSRSEIDGSTLCSPLKSLVGV